ncbi:NADH dehydrogenase FAD-containing subunit [Bacillus tianshenii]|uniref:NADH dehydrogenase FAD-containing subunit n=1 Tax=Sutcliffiella tianshenii TaxID=1463404 RepID=A0ABS2NYI2_9BACI|nr:FAD-dependent oxidoreductase [Bacillus tianshenii]MBM7619701.1 NADH dehydrogenase FAD-containing subunit [Bacillus tianshenii]
MHAVILVGGGHAHIQCLKQLCEESIPDTRFVLVSSNRYQYYSGMFSGFTEGLYKEEDIRIDLDKLSLKAGVQFIEATVTELDPENKRIVLDKGEALFYSIISFDIGSGTNHGFRPSSAVRTVKPNYTFPGTIKELRDSPSPVIVGGGAAGVEISLSILARKRRLGQTGQVTLISSSRLLPGAPKGASVRLEDLCRSKGLQIFVDEEVEKIEDQIIRTSNRSIKHSGVLLLTGPASSPLFRKSGMSCTEEGYLLVQSTLQSESHPEIFGAGDCVTLSTYPELAKNGVYAVRQGPVLLENIKRTLTKRELTTFEPQKRFLSILSTGGKEAMLLYDRFYFQGKSPWKLKNRIDRSFMKKYT